MGRPTPRWYLTRKGFRPKIPATALRLSSVAIGNGKTATVDLRLPSALDGVSGARLTVSVEHTDVARISGASYADGFLEATAWLAERN